MTSAVLLEDTSEPVELRCNSVELTYSNRDAREIIEHILREFEFDHSGTDDLQRDVDDARFRIYQAALKGDWEEARSTADYAKGIEAQLKSEFERIDSVRSDRFVQIRDQLNSLLSQQYGIDDTSELEYAIPALTSILGQASEEVLHGIPFLVNSEVGQEAIQIFVNQSLSALDLSVDYEDDLKMIQVVRELPLPVYGSKPETLVSLQNLIQGSASLGVVGYSEYFHGPVMALVTTAGAFLVWFAKPHIKTLREYSNKWVEEWSKDRLRYRDEDEDKKKDKN